jgi:hypothetical protein
VKPLPQLTLAAALIAATSALAPTGVGATRSPAPLAATVTTQPAAEAAPARRGCVKKTSRKAAGTPGKARPRSAACR